MGRGRYLSAGHSGVVAPESEKKESGQEREDKIERLTKELSGLINEAGTQGREELRDYAVSLIQAETETTLVEEAAEQPQGGRQTGGMGLLALSIPLFLIGIFLLLLFPPVGMVMLLFAGVMVVGGGLYTLLFHRK